MEIKLFRVYLCVLNCLLQANIVEITVDLPQKSNNKSHLVRSVVDDFGGSIQMHLTNNDKVVIRGPKDDVEKTKIRLLELISEKVLGD